MKAIGRILNIIRLGLFPLSYGIVGALMGSTLNRVMLADIGFRAIWVGIFFAAPDLIAPIRVWLGYRSDGFPIGGRRREPYIVLGAVITGVALYVITALAVTGEVTNILLLLAIVVAFVVYGAGRNMEHNTWQALLADKFHGDARPRIVTAYEVVTVLGLIMGAGLVSSRLEDYDSSVLLSLALGIAIVTFILVLVASILQEPRTSATEMATEKARELNFAKAFKEFVWDDRPVRLFFFLILFTFVGTLAQDVFLEPYGALVLDMNVSETARLTQFWGVGLILSMLIGGSILIKLLGYMRVLRIGLVASIVVFVGVILVGVAKSTALFNVVVLVMGISTGLAAAGMLTIIINFTSTLRAGLLLGTWGVANQLGRALGSLMGGGVVEVMQAVTDGDYFIAYGSVFALEIVMLVIALVLSYRLDLGQSRARAEEDALGATSESAG